MTFWNISLGRSNASLVVRTYRSKDNECSKQIHYVWKVLAIERFSECPLLVWPCEKQMEKGNDSAFKFRPSASIDGCWGEGLPDNRFTDVGSDEEGDSGSLPYQR